MFVRSTNTGSFACIVGRRLIDSPYSCVNALNPFDTLNGFTPALYVAPLCQNEQQLNMYGTQKWYTGNSRNGRPSNMPNKMNVRHLDGLCHMDNTIILSARGTWWTSLWQRGMPRAQTS